MVDAGHQRGDQWDGFEDLDAMARAETVTLEASIAAVEASGRGQPVDQVEAGLVRELRARRLFVPPAEINLLAQGISDRWWALKHPWASRRRFAAMRSAANAAESAFQDEWDRTLERLQTAMESMWRLRRSRVSSRRTIDGFEVEIRIDPWSPQRARKLRQIAAPMAVTVVPFDS